MICSRCGKPLPQGATTCAVCGAPGIAPILGRGGAGASPVATAIVDGAPAYAGFWLRVLAYVIDSIVVGFVSGFAGSFIGGIAAGVLGASGAPAEYVGAVVGLVGALVAFVLGWLYFAILESSGKQATLGKMALGLAVTDAGGRPVGFGRATGRYFAKLLSAVPLLIGFALAGFTARKQALHDMVAGTLVVKRREGSSVGVVIAVAAAVVIGGIFIVGILAAIAIPNFLRYQLRSKASEATMQLLGIQAAEASQLARTRKYFSLEAPSGGRPGPMKMAWSPSDLALASDVGWPVAQASYFRYAVAAAATPDGQQAFSACAEADLDGDGRYEAWVLWHPALDASQNVVAMPPAPPCAHEPVLERSPLFRVGDPVGEPVKISPASVF